MDMIWDKRYPKDSDDPALTALVYDSLKLATIATHVAASKTMILHPASHTHRQMNDEQLAEAGVSPGMIRLSVGIENVDDIIADIEQALQNA